MSSHAEERGEGSAGGAALNVRSRMQRLIRIGVVALALLSLLVYAVGLPLSAARIGALCLDDNGRNPCLSVQLGPNGFQTLAALGITVDVYVAYIMSLDALNVLLSLAIGAVLFRRRPSDMMALFVVLALVLSAVNDVANTVANSTSGWRAPALVVNQLSFLSFVLLFYIFPDGRFAPRWTRWLMLAFMILGLSNALPNDSHLNVDNWPGWFQVSFFLLLASSMAFAQIYRYRRVSAPLERQQTKWVVFAIVSMIASTLGLELLPWLLPSLSDTGSLYTVVAPALMYWALLFMPLGFGIAMLRYRLYDIDIIINRALVYGTLTAILAVAYIGSVVSLQTVLRPLVGGDSELVTVASTLVIAALFQPLRRRIQHGIDRRFYRRKYDSQRVLEAFAARLRDETDLETLTQDMVSVVRETLQPVHVSLWVKQPDRKT